MKAFWTDARKELIKASYEKWKGTPHKDKVCKQQVGIDCVHLVMELLFDSGVLPRVPVVGAYCHYDRNSKVEKPDFEGLFHCERVPLDQLAFGDICICEWSNFWWHPMFCTGDRMIHICREGWVKKVSGSIWEARVGWAFRFFKEGFTKHVEYIDISKYKLKK